MRSGQVDLDETPAAAPEKNSMAFLEKMRYLHFCRNRDTTRLHPSKGTENRVSFRARMEQKGITQDVFHD